MPIRSLPSEARFKPDQTEVIVKAFDDAWDQLRGEQTDPVMEPLLMMLHGPIWDPGMERRRHVMRCPLVLAAIAITRLRARGYGVARPDAVKQTVSSSGGHFSEWVPSNRWQETG
jgi:hypothetical protein